MNAITTEYGTYDYCGRAIMRGYTEIEEAARIARRIGGAR